MKTANLTGAALDWAVAKCEGLLGFGYRTDGERFAVEDSAGEIEDFMPSTDWAQGGPIAQREEMTIEHTVDVNETYWKAWCWIDGEDAQAYGYGRTPLIAAMRCYVASKLGDNIELPEGLTNE